MDWIEATGKTVEEAIEKASEILNITRDDIETTVIEEPKVGLFGRIKTEAVIRARVRPKERIARNTGVKRQRTRQERAPHDRKVKASGQGATRAVKVKPSTKEVKPKQERQKTPKMAEERKERTMEQQQQDELAVKGFLEGLITALAVEAEISISSDEESTLAEIDGEGLGFLVGRKGTTLQAIQELVRLAVRKQGISGGSRVDVDIAGYKKKREIALAEFTRTLAEEVKNTGVAKALEPMNPADRKTVHNAASEIEGVITVSSGHDPRRYVIIQPAS